MEEFLIVTKSVKILYRAQDRNLIPVRYTQEYENVMAACFELCAWKKNEQSFKLRLIFTASTSCRALKLVKVKKLYFVNSTQEEETSGNKKITHTKRGKMFTPSE